LSDNLTTSKNNSSRKYIAWSASVFTFTTNSPPLWLPSQDTAELSSALTTQVRPPENLSPTVASLKHRRVLLTVVATTYVRHGRCLHCLNTRTAAPSLSLPSTLPKFRVQHFSVSRTLLFKAARLITRMANLWIVTVLSEMHCMLTRSHTLRNQRYASRR
jgi:hypothetical protein